MMTCRGRGGAVTSEDSDALTAGHLFRDPMERLQRVPENGAKELGRREVARPRTRGDGARAPQARARRGTPCPAPTGQRGGPARVWPSLPRVGAALR